MSTQKEHTLREREPTGYTILIVEDDTSIGTFLQLAILQETSFHVCVVETAQHALEVVQQFKPSLFLLDSALHPTTGIALYDYLHAIIGLETVPAIITTTDFERYRQKIEERHLLWLSKPFELDVLLETIRNCLLGKLPLPILVAPFEAEAFSLASNLN